MPPDKQFRKGEIVTKTEVDIGSRVEMFVDDWLIERQDGASLRLNTPIKREIVLVTDQPWEGPPSGYYTVLQDGSRFRLYYRGQCPTDRSEEQVACLAESTDGINFTRPNLGLYEVNGSSENNVIWLGTEGHNFAPFLDTNPNAKPEERYKALGRGGGRPQSLFAFSSPDGIRWKRMQEKPVTTKGAFDSLNIAFWDTNLKAYQLYSRYFSKGEFNGIRAIQSSISKDFLNWADPVKHVYSTGVPLEHFYTNATVQCPGAPHIYLSFPKRFVPERTKLDGYEHPGVSDAVFMSSRDGVHWDRTFMEAWVRPGPDEKNWTQRGNMPAWGILQIDPDEFSMYISEHYEWPGNRLRRITIRRHGFASVNAGYGGGEFTTRPLTFSGKRLILNYATSAVGSVQVEVQDEGGRPLADFALSDMDPLYGDELDAVTQWRGGDDLSDLIGRPVRLRFVLKDADIYSLRFGA